MKKTNGYGQINADEINRIRESIKIPKKISIDDIICLTDEEWYYSAIPSRQVMSMNKFRKLRYATKTNRCCGRRPKNEKRSSYKVLELVETGKFDLSKFTAQLIILLRASMEI